MIKIKWLLLPLLIISMTLLSARTLLASNQDDFRVRTPANWSKISRDLSGGVYQNTSSKSGELVIATSYPILTAQMNQPPLTPAKVAELKLDLAKMRARNLLQLGLHDYTIVSLKIISSPTNKINSTILLQSRFLDFAGNSVYVTERQDFTSKQMYQVIYEKTASSPPDQDQVAALLGSFQVRLKSKRSPAGSETASGSTAQSSGAEIQSQSQPSNKRTAELCQSVPVERRRTEADDRVQVLKLEDLLGCMSAYGIPTTISELESFRKAIEPYNVASGALWGTLNASKSIASCVVDSVCRAETEASAIAYGQLLLHPSKLAEPIALALDQYARQVYNEWPCLNDRYRSKIFCQVVGISAASRAIIKIGLGLTLAVEESAELKQTTESVLRSQESKPQKILRPPTGSDKEILDKLQAEAEANPKNKHQIEIRDGLAYVDIRQLNFNQIGFSKALVNALKKGLVAEIDAGPIIGPKVITLLTDLGKIVPADRPLRVKGFLSPQLLLEQIETSRASPSELKSLKKKARVSRFSDLDAETFNQSMRQLKAAEGCEKKFGEANLAHCGYMYFEFEAHNLESIEWH